MRNSAKPKKNRKQYSSHNAERRIENLFEQLAQFEDFKATILPALQQDLQDPDITPAKLREKYAAILQARLITDALSTKDEGKAATIIKDVLDRTEGKAVEKKEYTHRFENMTDHELESVLQSELNELQDMEDRFQKNH